MRYESDQFLRRLWLVNQEIILVLPTVPRTQDRLLFLGFACHLAHRAFNLVCLNLSWFKRQIKKVLTSEAIHLVASVLCFGALAKLYLFLALTYITFECKRASNTLEHRAISPLLHLQAGVESELEIIKDVCILLHSGSKSFTSPRPEAPRCCLIFVYNVS